MSALRSCEWCKGPLPTRRPGVGGRPRTTCSALCRCRKAAFAGAQDRKNSSRKRAYALARAYGIVPIVARTFGSPESVEQFIALVGRESLRADAVGSEQEGSLGPEQPPVSDAKPSQGEVTEVLRL